MRNQITMQVPKIQTRIFIVAFVTLFIFGSITFGQKRRSTQVREQVSFGSEAKVRNVVKLPKDVIEQLAEYDGGRLNECQRSEISREKNIANHFAATKINLNGDSQLDLVVQAQTLCFMGAHNTTFWVFTEVEQRLSPGYELVFSDTADFMQILKTSTNGYKDIETGSHTALELYTTVWKFNGSKYEPRICKIEDFKTKKVTNVKCES